MSKKIPQPLKRPVRQYVLDRLAGFAAREQQIAQERNQFLQDAAGIEGVDPTRFGVWWDFEAQPPTYEVMTLADLERRVRLHEAAQQARGLAGPREGEKQLDVLKGAAG